jgi:arylsulfatase A-like enzyme
MMFLDSPCLGIFAATVALTFCACGHATEAPQTQQPNVLFISIDDLNDWVGPLAGNAQALTPTLDRFASESVTFRRNYTPSPGCNPSRTATLTGLHTYSSGMYSNYQDWRDVPALRGVQTLNQHFRDEGYFTAGAGKIYHYTQVDEDGWDAYFPSIESPMPQEFLPESRPVKMQAFPFMYGAFDWSPLALKDEETADFRTVDWVGQQLQRDHAAPFFLAAGIYRPHLPWYVPQEYFDRFPLASIRKPALLENDLDDLGPVAKELIMRGGGYHRGVLAADQWTEAIQGYLASVAYADAMLGRLLDQLAASPYADNTIVVIWSDHGWQLGEKNHWRKFALWENVIRTVLMVKVPEGLAALPGGSANGQATDNLTSLLDIYPTLVELAGLTPREDLDGVSLVPILRDPAVPQARAIISTYDYGSYSVRFSDWHYIRYIDDSEELYDLSKDPEEWHNLAAIPGFEAVKEQLASHIPQDPIDLPEESLLELQEHHVPPIRSRDYFFSQERADWMKRFE